MESALQWAQGAVLVLNILLGVFNARLGWFNWRKSRDADFPAVWVQVERTKSPTVFEFQIHMRSRSDVAWKGLYVEISRPRGARLANMLTLATRSPTGGFVFPHPDEVDRAKLGRRVPLFLVMEPQSQASYREVLWAFVTSSGRSKYITLELVFESFDPKPRRYRAKLKRATPTLNIVSTT